MALVDDGQPVRMGLIGLGSMGRHHARVVREVTGLELVAVADPLGDKLGVAGGLEVLPDVEVLIGAGIDAAMVAVPTYLHEEAALTLATDGVHTMVEKPIAATAESGRPALRGQRRRDQRLGPVTVFRGVSEGDSVCYAIAKQEPLRVEQENFRDRLWGTDSTTSPTVMAEGVHTLTVVEATLESAATGTTTCVPHCGATTSTMNR